MPGEDLGARTTVLTLAPASTLFPSFLPLPQAQAALNGEENRPREEESPHQGPRESRRLRPWPEAKCPFLDTEKSWVNHRLLISSGSANEVSWLHHHCGLLQNSEDPGSANRPLFADAQAATSSEVSGAEHFPHTHAAGSGEEVWWAGWATTAARTPEAPHPPLGATSPQDSWKTSG